MSNNTLELVALDVGEKRIGIARADTRTKLAFPVGTIEVDGIEIERLQQIVAEVEPSYIVVGYPRNQSGEKTKQTEYVERFAESLAPLGVPVVFQDESLTSVVAEERLKNGGRHYTKSDVDSEAATIILQDYIEAHYGHTAA